MIKPLIDVEFFGATDVGKKRTNNEDCFIAQYIWENQFVLCAAIDGMGGYEGGEVAADIARFTLINDMQSFQGNDVFAALKQAFINANNEIVRYREASPKYSSMGCVATVGLFDIIGRQLYMVHVGDSRLYRFQDGELQKLSHDHSMVGYREEIGDLTEEEAMNHPQRSVISRSVGHDSHMVDDEHFLEASIFPLLSDAEYLFCSDGLSDMLRSYEIREILANKANSVESKVQHLIDAANQAGGKDNVTVVLTKIRQLQSRQKEPTPIIPMPLTPKKKKRFGKLLSVIAAIIIALAIAATAVIYFQPTEADQPQPEPTPVPVDQTEATNLPETANISDTSDTSEPSDKPE